MGPSLFALMHEEALCFVIDDKPQPFDLMTKCFSQNPE